MLEDFLAMPRFAGKAWLRQDQDFPGRGKSFVSLGRLKNHAWSNA
jgi:hypothetical protein